MFDPLPERVYFLGTEIDLYFTCIIFSMSLNFEFLFCQMGILPNGMDFLPKEPDTFGGLVTWFLLLCFNSCSVIIIIWFGSIKSISYVRFPISELHAVKKPVSENKDSSETEDDEDEDDDDVDNESNDEDNDDAASGDDSEDEGGPDDEPEANGDGGSEDDDDDDDDNAEEDEEEDVEDDEEEEIPQPPAKRRKWKFEHFAFFFFFLPFCVGRDRRNFAWKGLGFLSSYTREICSTILYIGKCAVLDQL